MTDALKAAADVVDAALLEQVRWLAEAEETPLLACYERLTAEIGRRAQERTGVQVVDADGRNAAWRVRVRLYDQRAPDEPQADSDDDRAVDDPGAAVLRGLPAVAEHLAALAQGFHGTATCTGLEPATLRHRIKSLRPTLSRKGGAARWRVPYTVTPLDSNGAVVAQAWLATVNVQREN